MSSSTSPEVRICVYVTLTEQQISAGWSDDYAELEGSIRATLHEIIGDDGMPYVPKIYGIDVDADEPATVSPPEPSEV